MLIQRGSKVKQTFNWKSCQLRCINYKATGLFSETKVLERIELVPTCLICLDEMMTSLESDVSGASLSGSATIASKHHDHKGTKMTQSQSCMCLSLIRH